MIDIKLSQDIEKDVWEEFGILRKDVQRYYRPNYDINHTKSLLKNLVPELVEGKRKLLLDTLINYLMKKALTFLEPANTDLKNAFFDMDLRKKFREIPALSTESISFSIDPRYVYGGIAAGGTLVLGKLLTVYKVSHLFIPGSMIGKALTSFIILGLSGASFKITYNKSEPKSRKQLEKDIEEYIAKSEDKVLNWLKEIVKTFDAEFNKFCNEHNFKGGKNG